MIFASTILSQIAKCQEYLVSGLGSAREGAEFLGKALSRWFLVLFANQKEQEEKSKLHHQNQNIMHTYVEPESPDSTPEFEFQLINSQNTIHIRSLYTLLTEDFAIWSKEKDCQSLQNWDLTLTQATGYHQLEVKIDPPFLECLQTENNGNLQFRIALLQ